MDYLDFELTVRGGETGYVVEVRSPAGEAVAPFTLERPEPFPTLLAAAQERSLDATEAQQVGAGLFDALVPGPIRERYRESLGMVRERGARLVISFRCEVPDIAGLPWELLYDPVEARFLAASLETSFARYVPLPARQRTVTVRPPLRLLLVAASPAGLAPLDVDGELARIRSVLRPLQAADQLEVRLLQHATPDSLREALDWGPHLLHMISHGQRGDDGVGELVLEDKYGDPLVMSAGDLASFLNETEVRCLVLMACHSAGGSGTGPFSGLGPALVRAGVAAVVTLQQELPDKAALEFSTAFYRAIADGQSVGVAINIARRDMRAAGGQQRGEWAIPVLHTRYPGGQVFVSPGSPGATVRVDDAQEERKQRPRPKEPDGDEAAIDEGRQEYEPRPLPARTFAMAGGAVALVLVIVALLAWRAGMLGASADGSPTPTVQALAPTAPEPAAAAPTAAPTPTPAPTDVPTPTPSPTSAPSAVLSDSLGDPRTTVVPGASASTGDYQYGFDLSEYFIRTSNPNYQSPAIAVLADHGANSGIALDARLDGDATGRYIALGCRRQPGNAAAGLKGYILRVDPAGQQFKLARADGQGETDLIPWQTSFEIYPGTASNQLEMDCYGNQLNVLINGQAAGTATDSTYGTGVLFFGVGVFSNAAPATVDGRFKNLVVTGS